MKNEQKLSFLTGQESGIVLYPKSNEAIICNWVNINGLPHIDPMGVSLLGLGENLDDASDADIVNLLDQIRGYNIVWDANDDISIITSEDTCYRYRIGDVIILAPCDWN